MEFRVEEGRRTRFARRKVKKAGGDVLAGRFSTRLGSAVGICCVTTCGEN